MADPIAWPFEWGGDYTEQLEWLTDVMTAPTGGTQHRRLRTSPRVTLSFSTLLQGDRRRALETQLRGNLAASWWVPVPIDGSRLQAAAAALDTSLSLDLGIARIVVGNFVMLVNDDFSACELCEIDAVGSGTLTLVAGLAAAWPAGTLVVPVRGGRLAEVPAIGRFTSDATDLVPLQFQLYEPLESDAAFAGATYRGLPVFDFVPVWSSDPAWSPERSLATVDYGTAPPMVVDLAGVPLGRTTLQYTMDTAARVAAFRSALYALAGRWSPAWVPSWAQDLRIASPVVGASSNLDIAGPLLSGQALNDNRRDLRIALVDGSVLYRRIVTVTDMGGGIERLALDAAFTGDLEIADVAMISFIALSVQEADTNLLRYFAPDVLDCELTWRELDHGL